MEEAENELILVDDPLIKFHVGEVFLNVAPEKNEEMLKALQERTRKTLEEIEVLASPQHLFSLILF